LIRSRRKYRITHLPAAALAEARQAADAADDGESAELECLAISKEGKSINGKG